jgi:hypothetical protein
MNKDVNDSTDFNRVYGLDGNFRLGQFTSVNASLATSSSPSVESANSERKLAFAYVDPVWSIRTTYLNTQDNFTNQMGYVPRRGIQRAIADVRPSFRIQSLARFLRAFSPHTVVDYVMDRDGRIDSKYVDWHAFLMFQNGAWTEFGRNDSVEVLTKPFRLNSKKSIPEGVYRYPEWFIMGWWDPSRSVVPTGRIGIGEFYNGRKRNYVIGASWRLNYRANASVNFTRNVIALSGEAALRTNLFAARFNYSFSTSVFLSSLLQYNSDAQQWSTNIRLNVIHRPLSDIFVVLYNERRNSTAPYDLVDRAIIAKLTYMLSQ